MSQAWFDGSNRQARIESFAGVDSVLFVGVGQSHLHA